MIKTKINKKIQIPEGKSGDIQFQLLNMTKALSKKRSPFFD
jgi:hypothetical protein